MTDKEIIQALRCCEKEVCADGGLCPLFSDADCIVHLGEAAIDLIERLTAANAELREKRRWIPFHSEAAGDIQYCSACDIGFDARMDYCPHRGARMDGWMEDAYNG